MAPAYACALRAPTTFSTLIKQHRVSHLCGAPIVLNLMANADDKLKQKLEGPVNVMTAGSAPPAAVLEAMAELNFKVTHTYGLTEVYGPAAVCAWHEEWDHLSPGEQASLESAPGCALPNAGRTCCHGS